MGTRFAAMAHNLGLLVLRLGAGGWMMTHGWGKVQMVFDGKFDQFGDPIGIGPTAGLLLATFAEFVCALLVVIGLGTRFATIPLIITMAVAAFIAHGNDPWTMGEAARLFMAGEAKHWGSKEPALLFLSAFLALMLTGPGRFSFDALIWGKRKGSRAAVAA